MPKEVVEINAIVAVNSQKIKALEKRMEKVENNQKNFNELTLSVKEIAMNQTRMLEDMKEEKETRKHNEQRISNLELQPAHYANELKQKIIIAVCTGVVSAIIGAVLALVIK